MCWRRLSGCAEQIATVDDSWVNFAQSRRYCFVISGQKAYSGAPFLRASVGFEQFSPSHFLQRCSLYLSTKARRNNP
ncbi:MAG TPA: hypothetical protein DF774_10705 [Rheinheimera sp.]|nr:hypothetical protein [Rheinheimera sp.]